MTSRKQVEPLYTALAAILNALEAAGEGPRPFTDGKTGFSGVLGSNGSVNADRDSGSWVVFVEPEDGPDTD
ncbi:hypothetical protein [Streptomyces malaysiensis]